MKMHTNPDFNYDDINMRGRITMYTLNLTSCIDNIQSFGGIQ